jgi:hypothetical protein
MSPYLTPNESPMTSMSGITEHIDPAASNEEDAMSCGSQTESAIGTAGCVITVHMSHLCTKGRFAQAEIFQTGVDSEAVHSVLCGNRLVLELCTIEGEYRG